MAQKIRVLVVDDSAFMRKAIGNMLASDPEIEVVGTARDGSEGLEKALLLKPDLVTLDVEMPRMDGLTALKHLMEQHPLPVLMLSSLTEEGAEATLRALDLGAVDYIPKHLDNISFNIVKIKDELLQKVKVIGRMRRSFRRVRPQVTTAALAPMPLPPRQAVLGTQRVRVVAIGTSTGGPKALQEVLPLLPKEFPVGILVVQHMPKAFTGPFARRLDDLCPLRVREAEDHDLIERGTVLIAPGGRHMKARRRKVTELEVQLTDQPEGLLHRPSVDVLMTSVAEAYGGSALGIILTGMGSDGKEGIAALKREGGKALAQDEASCVVYGMPKAVVEAGLADKVVHLDRMAGEIVNMV